MKFREKFSSFDKTNKTWDNKQRLIEKKRNIKKNNFHPKIKTVFPPFFRIKSLIYLIKQDKNLKFTKFILKKPSYFFNLLKSYLSKRPYLKEKDLFLYNLKNLNELKELANNKNTLFIFGFSYCQKPLDCPKKRFSSDCLHDHKNDICSQCFIGKCANAINKKDLFFIVPDVRFIAEKLLEILDKNKDKEIVFLINSCELSIKMFSDFANMLKIKGLAIKLTRWTCPNFKSFLYAEKGKKAGITDLDFKNKDFFLEILKIRYSCRY